MRQNWLWMGVLKHMSHIVQACVGYYNTVRLHQSLGNVPLMMNSDPIPIRAAQSPPRPEEAGVVLRHELLGGLLSHYERKAA